MNRYKRLAANTAILGVGTFSSKLLVLLLMPLYTGILSAEQYGIADLISQTANLIIPLACVGLADGIFRFALDAPDKKRVFTNGILIMSAGTIALFALSPVLLFFGTFDGYRILIIAYVLFANIHSVTAQYLRGQGKTALFAAQGIVNTLLCITFNILFLVAFDMGAFGYVLSVVAADFIVSVYLIVYARLYREFDIKLRDRNTFRAMLFFSLPYIPTTMLWLIISTSGRFFLKIFRGSAETGLYAASMKIPTLLMLVSAVFIEAWQFSAVKDADGQSRHKFFEEINKSFTSVMIIAASAIILGARVFTKILLDASYYSSWRYIPILALATMFTALVSFTGSVYFVEKKSFLSMMTALTGAFVNLVLNFILIPGHGAMGAAVSMLIAYIAVYIIRTYDTRRFIDLGADGFRLAANCAFLLVQAGLILRDHRYMTYASALLFVLITAINAPSVLKSIKRIIRG